ncbi:MAG: hypothetical protein QXV72_01925 [Sulfolobales archaeon]
MSSEQREARELVLLDELIRKCSRNSICVVEGFKLQLDRGYSPEPEEVRYVSALMGGPTKKVDTLKSTYIDVFTRLLEKNCYYFNSKSLCIYSWSPRVPVRYFPVSLDATGTIIALDEDGVSLLAYPTHRTYDLEGRGVELPDPERMRVVEVTSRIDGYQITFYFNPLLDKWIPATRYALHNMRYMKSRVIMEDLGNITNPYAAVADHIASSKGLYDRIEHLRGWTLTFVLEAPEPAIVKPNVELYDYESFRLYLVNARNPEGHLLTTYESSQLVSWDHVPIEKVEVSTAPELKKFVEMWSWDIYHRSRFVRFLSQDQVRPYTIEVRSKLYENAVYIKHSSDPKSLLILASHGLDDKAVELLIDYRDIKSVGKEICELYKTLRKLVSETLSLPILEEAMRDMRVPRDLFWELEKARRSGDIERFSRKLSLALASENIYDTREKLKAFIASLTRQLESRAA